MMERYKNCIYCFRFEQSGLKAVLQMKRKIYMLAIWLKPNLEVKPLLASVLYSVINRPKPLTTSPSCAYFMSAVCELSHAISVDLKLLANKQIKMNSVCLAWHEASVKPG